MDGSPPPHRSHPTKRKVRLEEDDNEEEEEGERERDVKPRIENEEVDQLGGKENGEGGEGNGEHEDGDGTLIDLSEEQRERLNMRDADGYLPGAVVRVSLKNFLTYDSAEFFPGPHLNMIVGPNGSGKSTIVCSIAIGLGWSPKVLGRADEINQFLKYGHSKGFTEIELKNVAGEPNLVIKRDIVRDSNSTKFYLDGRLVAAKVIRDKVTALNIQVGNLCSFLPQDKVSEFATMSPQELLKQTQKAAGPSQMTHWHETLIDLGKQAREVENELTIVRDEVQRKTQGAQRLEVEVENARERDRLTEEIEFNTNLTYFSKYHDARKKYDALREERKGAHAVMVTAQAASEPYEKLKEEFGHDLKMTAKKIKESIDSQTVLQKTMRTVMNKINTADEEVVGMKAVIDNHKISVQNKKDRLVKSQEELEHLTHQWDNRPEIPSTGQLDQERSVAQAHLRSLEDRSRMENGLARAHLEKEREGRSNAIKRAEQQVEELKNVGQQRMVNLKNWPGSEDIYPVVAFLRHNEGRVAQGHASFFKMKVFEPPCLSVNVPNRAYSSVIESCFNAAQLRTIICQCQEDFDTLMNFAKDENNPIRRRVTKLHLHLAQGEYRPMAGPVPMDRLQGLGFEGYAIDFVKAPDPVKNYLEQNVGLHRVAISLRSFSGPNGLDWKTIDQCPELQNFVAKDVSYQTTVSRYGKRTKSYSTSVINPVRSFTSTVDRVQIDRLQAQIVEDNQVIEGLASEFAKLKAKDDEIMAQLVQAKDLFNKANGRYNEAKQVANDQAALHIKLQKQQQLVHKLQNAPSEEQSRERNNKELQKRVLEKVGEDLKYKELTSKASKIYQTIVDLNLELAQIDVNIEHVARMAEEDNDDLVKAQRAFQQIQAKFQKQKDFTRQCVDEVQEVLDKMDEEDRDRFTAKKDELIGPDQNFPSVDDLKTELTNKQAELEAIGGADPAVVQKYEKAQREIKRLTENLESFESKERKVTREIVSTRQKWYPELQKLVRNFNAKFSAAMDALDDRGEVRIKEHEDYDQWAIEILVAFRAENKLQLLTSTHQSGGERSLATIMYLMSLIELSNAPFSLVDEINQGMDQRSEREVHNQMVRITCHKDAGQFFLLTPKLLTGLDYHERMRVLVVCNGEWLPERKAGDTKKPGDTSGVIYLKNILRTYKAKAGITS